MSTPRASHGVPAGTLIVAPEPRERPVNWNAGSACGLSSACRIPGITIAPSYSAMAANATAAATGTQRGQVHQPRFESPRIVTGGAGDPLGIATGFPSDRTA